MAKLLLNANGKVLMKDDKVYKAPESTLKKLLDVSKSTRYLFSRYTGTSVDDLIKYDDTENVEKMNNMFEYNSNLVSPPLLNTSKVKDMSYAFASCSSILEFPQYDYSQVENLRYTFSGCKKITIAVSLENTNNVTNFSYTFNGCSNITIVEKINTQSATTVDHLFSGCSKLETIIPLLNFSNVTEAGAAFDSCFRLKSICPLDTRKITYARQMFGSCYKIPTIDITSLDSISATNAISYFATNCYSLTKLIIRTMTKIPPLDSNSFYNCHHFTGKVESTYNPDGLKDGRIYVPDEWVEQLKSATNWSEYGDIIVPLSTLEE